MKKFFEKKLGEFVKAEKMTFDPGNGYVGLKKGEIKSEAFDQLHFPFALKGGFIDEMSISLPVSMFSNSAAKVSIKNVFLVFGPHVTDWSREDVYKCKTKLVDLISKIYELKPAKKPKKQSQAQGGWVADMKKKFIEDMKKKFLGMLEVEISNIHFRYEDAQTQVAFGSVNPENPKGKTLPFAAGFKMGAINVNSKANANELRTTGDWKHSNERKSDPLFCQNILTRRISAYWDIGEGLDLFETDMVPGEKVFQKFVKMNLREMWRLAVVENALKAFPPDHERRKYLEGPRFRERLDYHQYILFPVSLNAHVTVNRPSDAMKLQKAPLKDADVIFDPVEVALDSEQMRSMNELLAYQKTFKRKDDLFRTRPRESISKYLQAMASPTGKSSSSSSPSPAELERRQKQVVRSWWHHAFQGVRIMCTIPKSHLDQEELKQKAKLREEYISLCLEDMEAAAREKEEGDAVAISRQTTQTRLNEMQMLLPLSDILNWRNLARERRFEKLQHLIEEEEGLEEEDPGEKAAREAAEKAAAAMPNTLQVRMHFSACQGFFLVVADRHWADLTASESLGKLREVKRQDDLKQPPSPQQQQPVKSAPVAGAAKAKAGLGKSKVGNGQIQTRQLVIKAQALDIRMEAVQRGRNRHRIARLAELGIGSISVTNCNAKRSTPATRSARQILSILPFEHRQGVPLCVYVGVTTMEVFEKSFEAGDLPVSAVLEPSEGVSAHLHDFGKEERPELLEKLGFLKDFKDEVGRQMIFAFGRVGQVRALDYTPFRRRLEYFMKRGKGESAIDLVRRPSPLALDHELLVKLQRKVEKLTGKSNSLGFFEGVTDGVRGRLVDHYNSQHVLCKEVSLAPMRCKALRNGCPQTFHCQFHQMIPKEDRTAGVQPLGEGFGLLPWKAAMLLLPKADFAMGIDVEEKIQEEASKVTQPGKPKAVKERSVQPMDPATIVLTGTSFLKWGRNGKAKKRFIMFDESNNAIVWKDSESNKNIIGVIPLSKIQDVCEGIQTPVLKKVENKLGQNKSRIWSIIATDRTLDLQADNPQIRERWVAGLKDRYKKYLQRQTLETDQDKLALPKALEKKVKSYPDKFRSPLCDLRATCKRLQSVTALTKSVDASSNMAKTAGKGPADAAVEGR